MSRSDRREVERQTVAAMIRLFCHNHHQSGDELCADCTGLQDYTAKRLVRCPYGDNKPTCNECPIHCYRAAIQERIKKVMRYSGPRMLLRHPILAIRHMIDAHRVAPSLNSKRST